MEVCVCVFDHTCPCGRRNGEATSRARAPLSLSHSHFPKKVRPSFWPRHFPPTPRPRPSTGVRHASLRPHSNSEGVDVAGVRWRGAPLSSTREISPARVSFSLSLRTQRGPRKPRGVPSSKRGAGSPCFERQGVACAVGAHLLRGPRVRESATPAPAMRGARAARCARALFIATRSLSTSASARPHAHAPTGCRAARRARALFHLSSFLSLSLPPSTHIPPSL